MFLQSRKNLLGVQNFVLRVINNNCPELKAFLEGSRQDKRVNLTLVVMVVPLANGKLQLNETFYAITQELSVTGMGIVLDQQRSLDHIILGFSFEGSMTFIHATAKHLTPMGGGFYHLGLEMTEVVPGCKYPQLETLRF